MPILWTDGVRKPWDRIPLCFPAARGRRLTTILEIGPGRGDFLFHLAEANPSATVVGIELKSKRFFKLVGRVKKRSLTNVRLIQADARLAVKELFGPGTISEIHINFPDPWPKKRHTKNRLLNEAFIKDCARILKKGGTLSMVTDAEWYAEELKSLVANNNRFTPRRCITVPDTFFAQKWLAEGRQISYQRWVKFDG